MFASLTLSALIRWNFALRTWVDVVQLVAWTAIVVALLVSLPEVVKYFRHDRSARRSAALIAGAGIIARLLVPALPFNWYSGHSNIDWGHSIYSNATVYMPLPNQLLNFKLGFFGILIFNAALGVVSAVIAWQVARRCRYGERVSLVFGFAVALVPMYVRISVSDSTHFITLPLWLLAALALSRLFAKEGGWPEILLLCGSIVATGPVRIEAALAIASIIPFVCRDVAGLREFWRSRGLVVVCAVSLTLGIASNMFALSESWMSRLHTFEPLIFILQMTLRMLFIMSIDPMGWLPLVAPPLVWYYIFHTLKRGDVGEAAMTTIPYWIFSIPHAYAGVAIAGELPSHAIGMTLCLFILIGAAKGGVLLFDRVRLTLAASPIRRRGMVVAVVLLSVVLLAFPYRWTYQYMEEFAFLSSALPKKRAKVVAIWEAISFEGDLDCCLSLPYTTFIGDFPEIEWEILEQKDLDEARIRNLQFDYYYPGSIVGLDVERFNMWFNDLFAPDLKLNMEDRAAVRKLQKIDELIRNVHHLEVDKQATVTARTFSFAPFPDNRTTLTLYRAVNGARQD